MKKTTLSLAISFLIVNSYTPTLAAESNISPVSTSTHPQFQDSEQPPNAPPQHHDNEQSLNNFPQNPNDSNPLEEDNPPKYPQNLNDFGLSQDQFENFNADEIANINPDVFGAFEVDDFNHMSPEAMSGFTPDQFAQIDRTTLKGISEEQFNQLPPEALANMDLSNIGGFNPELFGQFDPEHFQQFNAEQFEQADPRDIFRMIANSDPENIKPENLRELLPEGWTIDKDGIIELPEGEGFALPPISKIEGGSSDVIFPEEIPDLNNGLGIGGQGEPMINGLNEALARANLPQFDIKQDEKGIMQVTGSDEYEGINLAFLPDIANMKQGNANFEPGLSQDKRGLYVLTTANGQMVPIRPVPKDIEAIKNLLPIEGSQVTLGDEGDVLMNIPEFNGQPPIYGAGIFDPFINPAPEGLAPGIHLPNDPTGLEPALIVYEDGTSQIMNPTIPSPDEFIEQAEKFVGVDNTQYNGDGSISLTYEGNPVKLNPTFIVRTKELPANVEEVETSITLLDGGFLEYRIQQNDEIVVFKVKINLI
jgi:hypothetical protein